MTEDPEANPAVPGDHTADPEAAAEDDDVDATVESGGADATDGASTGTDAGTDTGADAAADLTHTDDAGDVQMVDVGDKPDSARRAVARGEIRLRASTVDAVRDDEVGKGDVLATARIGAIQAVKHTWETVPMCHQIPITNVDTDFSLDDDRVTLAVAVETTGKTGCEMEAIQGVTTGLGVVWDMVKAVEKDAEGGYPETGIEGVRVVEKGKRQLG